jgi:hypothetical protein
MMNNYNTYNSKLDYGLRNNYSSLVNSQQIYQNIIKYSKMGNHIGDYSEEIK